MGVGCLAESANMTSLDHCWRKTMFLAFILTICLIQRAEAKIYLVNTTDTDTDNNIQFDRDAVNNEQAEPGKDYNEESNEYIYSEEEQSRLQSKDAGNDIQTEPESGSRKLSQDYSRPSKKCKGKKNRRQCK